MLISLLKTILASLSGPNASGLIDLLHGKKNVNEFLIAKKLKLTINQTRNILYKLADDGLVSFIRKKDAKKGGWYTYFWTLNADRCLQRYRERLTLEIKNLERQAVLWRAGKFYICKNCHLEFNEEQALVHSYVCQECGEVLTLKDNSSELAATEKQVERLKGNLAKVDVELQTLHVHDAKLRARKMKAEQKRKQEERTAKRKITARATKRARKAIAKLKDKAKKLRATKRRAAKKARRKK